jgi:hypothetical protein
VVRLSDRRLATGGCKATSIEPGRRIDAATVESVRALNVDLTALLPREYYYSSVPLCVIDGVFP